MKKKTTVIGAADILLPPYDAKDPRWETYSVIACDQFTSEPEYWQAVRERVGDSFSAYSFILPEAYLGTPFEKEQAEAVRGNMKNAVDSFRVLENCLIYIERTLPDGRIRPGIVGKLDLEAYDFSPDSASFVRATEETVVSRIPPRVAVRKEATIELPHVMVFANDREKKLIAPLREKKSEMELIYSFTLMQGGGSIEGYKIEGELLCEVLDAIAEYESADADGLVYAMGDGNHSLASAKAHFENIKKELGDKAYSHPARYALVEVVDLYEESIEFEPIYRLLLNCRLSDFTAYMNGLFENAPYAETEISCFEGENEIKVKIPGLHPLGVGSLQMAIDGFIRENPHVICDYIHGADTLKKLSRKEGSVGFLCDGILKEELFGYVKTNGTLPRKTFSMGEAASKRYYLEARNIVD